MLLGWTGRRALAAALGVTTSMAPRLLQAMPTPQCRVSVCTPQGPRVWLTT